MLLLRKKTQPAVLDWLINLKQPKRSSWIVWLPCRTYAGLQLLIQVQISRGWLVCEAPSIYVESQDEGMPYKVWTEHYLLTLTYIEIWEEGMLYQVQIIWTSSHMQTALHVDYQLDATETIFLNRKTSL